VNITKTVADIAKVTITD